MHTTNKVNRIIVASQKRVEEIIMSGTCSIVLVKSIRRFYILYFFTVGTYNDALLAAGLCGAIRDLIS